MANEIIIDGIEYELKRKVPKPKFKVDDAVQYVDKDGSRIDKIRRISHLGSDRYYLNGGADYFQFFDQDRYELVGKYIFEFFENANQNR
jgi:hypothetical protein